MIRFRLLPALALLVAACLTHNAIAAAPSKTQLANGKVKVFILAGQSNMVGFGTVVDNDKPGTMTYHVKNEPKKYSHLVNNGDPAVRDDVYLVNLSSPGKQKEAGWLTVGFGASDNHIGPEYGFGWIVGDYYQDPVLIIKSSWGGRSLKHNFLPPSIEDYAKPQKDGDKGFHYYEILRHVKEVTGNLGQYAPAYANKDYEIVGFGWHQGWNDSIDQSAVDVYERNLVALIKDLRKDLGVEKMPFVSANTGMRGWELPDRYRAKVEKHVEAQLAPGNAEKYPEFKGNFAGVETRDFAFPKEQSPSGQQFHWNRNWLSMYLIGKTMGEAMVEMLDNQ